MNVMDIGNILSVSLKMLYRGNISLELEVYNMYSLVFHDCNVTSLLIYEETFIKCSDWISQGTDLPVLRVYTKIIDDGTFTNLRFKCCLKVKYLFELLV